MLHRYLFKLLDKGKLSRFHLLAMHRFERLLEPPLSSVWVYQSLLPPEAASVSQDIKLLGCSLSVPHEKLFHTKTYLHIPNVVTCITMLLSS